MNQNDLPLSLNMHKQHITQHQNNDSPYFVDHTDFHNQQQIWSLFDGTEKSYTQVQHQSSNSNK